MLVKSKLNFISLISVLLLFIQNVHGQFDLESRINAICRLRCDYNLMTDDGNNYCGRSCQIEECKDGCKLYPVAITEAPCQSVCSQNAQQDSTELVQSRSFTQIKVQSCTQGCLFSLDQYYGHVKDIISEYGDPVPHVIKDSITHSSVELSLPGFEEHLANLTNVDFILQTRIIDTHTEWQLHNYTELLPTHTLNITHLLPYVTYQFKLIFMITTEHTHNFTTQESVPVTTLPFGVPSSSPVITSLRAPRPAVISVSWQPPTFTNGPLVGYRLALVNLDQTDDNITADVGSDTQSWMFGNLLSGQRYEVRVSAVNREGEGPVHAMTVKTPNPGNLSEKDMPYLILGAENFVVKQRLLELTREAEKIYSKPKSILVLEGTVKLFESNSTDDLIEGVGVHIQDESVLVSDSSGRVSLINVSGDIENDDVYPMLVQPTNIDIDWLNNYAYIVDGNRINQCPIKRYGAVCRIVLDIAPLSPYELKVDPINGYLYYTVTEGNQGLYRIDLAQFDESTSPAPQLLLKAELKTFFIDHENLLLYFPNNSKNTTIYLYYTVTEGTQGLYRIDLALFGESTSSAPQLLLKAELKRFFIDHENLLLYFPNNSKNTIMYLYYTVTEGTQGLYRIDLAQFDESTSPAPQLLLKAELKTFFIDHENLLLYFPNNSKNTIMSAYLDGSGVKDIRGGSVARPHFINIESLIFYDEKFFWTNGTKVFSEEYDVGNRTYYHNSLLLFEEHFRGFNMLYPPAQPFPSPVNPPESLQVLFTSYKAILQWDIPDKLVFQGEGAYNIWEYEVYILQDDGTNNIFQRTTHDLVLEVTNLEPDTRYQVKVRAKSRSGNGPWSDIFYGRTLKEELGTAKIIIAVKGDHKIWEIAEVEMDGELPSTIVDTSPLHIGVTDLAWYEDKVFWTTDAGDLFMYWGKNQETLRMDIVKDATCVAFDWLSMKLYWSEYKNGVIRRSAMQYDSDAELVFQAQARDMVIDSIQGRLYWVTLNTVETTFLNGEGHQVYFQEKYFSGKNVISLSVDFATMTVFWYVKGYDDQSLYMADMFRDTVSNSDVLSSVKLVGSFTDIAERSSIQYFSEHLFWSDTNLSLMVGDKQCNYTSEITAVTDPVTMFTIKHPSLQPYPANLDKTTVQVIPSPVQSESIQCQGHHSKFNITWQPAVEVNHGVVLYELSLAADGQFHTLNVTETPWYEISNLPPYTTITVSLQGFTYWGSGELITRTVKSPMGVPSQPQAPKVYVTQRKSGAASKLSLAADFRWTEPVEINGVLSHQHVIYWKSSNPHAISSTTLSASARHFILDGLQGDTTYYFQVECCTPVGCSERSVVANATADAVNPVPKLLIAMEDRIEMAEADNVKNTSETIATKSVIAMGYLALDKTFFWITRDKMLEKYPTSSHQQLLKLSGEKQTMTLDWVSRSLYVAEINQTSSRILRYQIDESKHSVFVERNQTIGHIVVNPYTSSLIWSEKSPTDDTWTLMRMSTNNQGSVQSFSDNRRTKRAINNVCNCPPSSQVSSSMAVDLSQNGETEVIFVDTQSINLLAADMTGCQCRVLLSTQPADRQGLPPDYMTVDHVHIYWYQSDTQTLYALDKATKLVTSSQVDDVSDILAFGSHLHPLPGPECLDMDPYMKQVNNGTVTNTSIVVSFDPVSWPDVCVNISHPSVKYTVHYRVLDDMNPNEDCQSPGHHCDTKDSYSRDITLDNLEPYTFYIIQGAVSNYYSEYSANSLGEPVTIRTSPGVPDIFENFTVISESPHSIKVKWPPPFPLNGPIDKIVYYVKWSTQSTQGITQNFISDKIVFADFNPYSGMFEKDITMLAEDQIYTVTVVCNQTQGGYVTESTPQSVRTYQEPEDIELLVATNTSIQLSWWSPSDDSIMRVGFYCTEVVDGRIGSNSLQGNSSIIMVENYTEYNDSFHNLKPDTDYSIRLDIIYLTSNKIYHFPEDETQLKYVFRTLTGIPAQPAPPIVEELKDGEFEVTWTAPDGRGEPIIHYILQYRVVDKDNWSFAYNTSDLRWVIDDTVLQRGYTYLFRVLAENINGMGDYSQDSIMFSYPIKVAEEEKGMMPIIAVVCAFAFVLIAVSAIAVYFSLCRKGKDEKRKKADFIAVPRGPDLELATLRELPLTGIQQNNTLYAINLVPTDDEIAALPHFRRDQLVLCKFLGSGAFGEVFEGVAKNILNENSGETRCAVKTLRKSASDQEKEEFLKEALLMSNFRHEHILSLLGVCLDNDPQFIILELMEGGDLLSFMRACRLSSIQNRAELSITDIVKICVHVARGCKYLEDMHFVHRDLAARNCLVSSLNPSTMVVKIGDFGLARDIYKNDYYRKEGEGLLPVRWMSPESLVDGVFTTQSDIWAFGVLMWEVVTFGQQPYPARTNIEVLHYVRSGGRLDRHDNCPEDFYQLMCKCWSFAPEDRPTFAYLLQQLEKFEETCASISEYLVPIRTNNGPINTVDGQYRYLTQRNRRLMSTSSDGPDVRSLQHNNYASQRSYGKIHRATSFDSPEPKDATQRIKTDASNYLEPHSYQVPTYIEFLPDSRTQNYVYNERGERVRDVETSSQNSVPAPREPSYVQTTVKENFYPVTEEYMKYLQQKCPPKDLTAETYRKIIHQTSSADSVIMKTIENIPSACAGDNIVHSSSNTCSQTVKPTDSSVIYSHTLQTNGHVAGRFRKHRLDSGNSIMSFDSVQTEPAYSEYNNHRNKLYSSSSSKSNYSGSNISECITEVPAMVNGHPCINEENIQYWANNAAPVKGHTEVKGHADYLNLGRRSQVYPENVPVLNGYDIVQASLV